MKCPQCQTENPDTQKFCGECAAPLTDVGQAQPSFTKTMEAPREELTTGSTFAGRYQIIEELGKGGMGKVYKAVDTKINEKIALKLIKPEIASDKKTLERFANELKLARKIAHTNVGRMFDINDEQGTHYITMEYVSGQDLKGLIRQTGQLAVGTAISIAKQICEGLSEAHKVGVVHRDLKPNNIMIDREGQVRIMDFGIARSLREKGITGAGVMIGTPEYMSPEQAEAKDVDHRSDIYSLGVILYEMLTGGVPFEGDSALSVAMKHKGESPKDPREFNPQVSEDLSILVLKCLEKEKDKRFQSAEDLFSELSGIEKSVPTSDRAIPKRKASTSKEITVSIPAKRLFIPALGVIVILIVALFIWRPWSSKPIAIKPSKIPEIAVLPFEDLSPNKDQEPFCDGLADALTRSLSQLTNLRVRGKASSAFFKGSEEDNRAIGEKLAVQFLLRGSLQKEENSIRVYANLVDVSDDTVLWSDSYDGELGDTFAFQDKIAMAVVDELEIQLQAGEESALSEHPTDSIEALQAYQLGRYFRYKMPRTADMMLQAREYFEQAIEIDPTFSAAFAQLAESLMMLQGIGWMPWKEWEENERSLRNYAQRALDLDPFSSVAHSALGVLLEVFDNDWEGAEKEFLRAIELNPNDFGARWEYALLLMRTNRLNRAEEECLKALEIEPLSTAALSTLEDIYNLMGLEDRAAEVRKTRYEINPPALEERDYVEIQKERIKKFGRNPQFLFNLGYHYARSGNVEDAEKKIGELKSLHDSHRLNGAAYMIARLYNNLGRKDMTLDWLEKAADNQDHWLMDALTMSWMESVRTDPRFRRALEKFGFGKYLSP